MNIPPFPSQDLAKLVLGYLAEEQLMTAYDEFLQASPYLDAFGNEYDRIFMTSLKNILAEYRAVKIYVETCKPFHLRKKLFQCSNLLELVKFLIQHVDVNKIQQENTQSKVSVEKQNISITANNCEACKSLKLEACTCTKSPQSSLSSVQSRVSCDTVTLNSSVEATALSDLPGNHVITRTKNICTSDSEVTEVDGSHNRLLPISNVVSEKSVSNSSKSSCTVLQISQNNMSQNNNTMVKLADSLDLKYKEEFNKVLNLVCHNNQSDGNTGAISQTVDKQKMSLESYKNFATGVHSDSGSAIVPDSSTSENIHLHVPVSIENSTTSSLEANKIKQTRTQYLLKVAHVTNTTKPNDIVSISTVKNHVLPRLRPKPDESKVKILSDVKVDNSFNSSDATMQMPPVLKNATSTPLLQLQTIVINGKQVYRQKPFGQTHNYTKDEIMAMPTIILAPASGPPPANVQNAACFTTTPASNFTETSNSARSLGPLVIDVASSSSSVPSKRIQQTTEVGEEQSEPKSNVVPKTFDLTSASVPKDNTVAGTTETSTPQVLPLLRKSSSTPRRSSHVRVLDFTTPRRILHDSMNKCANTAASSDVEVVISSSPNIHYPVPTKEELSDDRLDVTTGPSKENSVNNKIIGKKTNWDADLRALAVVSGEVSKATPKSKSERKKKDRKSSTATKEKEKKNVEKLNTKKKTPKRKSSKKKNNPEPHDEKEISIEPGNVTVKPTINIIAGSDRVATVSDSDKNHNKSNNDNVDTPEMERMSLQHEIGVKLNISDILETPYKQALYEIQMETPKFLGPDLPDDPMSDIKIMNIPTPRFLNAPTPSSYSSRPTDYSSGGSYYKPDEQDYMRITDDICPVTSSIISKDNIKSDVSCSIEIDSEENEKGSNDKPSRPVRQCTKNVSYYNNLPLNSKNKETEDEAHSISSDIEDDSFCEIIIEQESKGDTNKDNSRIKTQNKSHTKTSKKRKIPVKKEVSKSFMKIKPRRITPTKKDSGKRKRRTPENSKVQTRKMATKREGSNVSEIPSITPAPTKSRRKSSTPRKLQCTKTFNSESSGHDSPDLLAKAKETVSKPTLVSTQDSDTEQLPLRWSDDGSQDAKPQDTQPQIDTNPTEIEDINKIQEYIKTVTNVTDISRDGPLHIDLVNRGFDLETAKNIERDLLDPQDSIPELRSNVITLLDNVESAKAETKNDSVIMEKTLDSDCSVTNNLQIVQEEEEEGDEIELSVHECNEDTVNHFAFNHDDTKDVPKRPLATLKDKFSMEVCLDDDLSIRLRATPFSLLLDQDPDEVLLNHNEHETEMAVRSISNMDKLYTPVKESMKAQCYEIFDSTLTSLDTPLKARSPRNTDMETEVTVTEIVMEVEKIDVKGKFEPKKRKRVQSGNILDENESKKPKPEAQYLLNSASIQNIDIESVLSKLHGP